MEILQTLLEAALASQAERGPARVAELRAAVADALAAGGEVTAEALEQATIDKFAELRGGDDPYAEDTVAALHALADVCDAVREHATAADEQRAAVAAEVDALAARLAGDTPADPDAAEPDAPDTPDATDPPAAPEAGAETAPEPALVAASPPKPARRSPKVPLTSLRSTAANTTPPARSHLWRAAADLNGITAGSEFKDFAAFVDAAATRFGALGRGGGTHGRMQAGIASVYRDLDTAFLDVDGEVTDVELNRLTDEARLPGGSLVAAGGWCAPSEILYDLCEPADIDGLVDLPNITTRRGGIRWPNSPDFATIYGDANASFHLTEAQVIAGTAKPCYEVPCNTFNELRLDVDGVCVKSPILTERGYPELVRNTIAQIMAVHAHKINAQKLAQMEAASTAVTLAGADPFGPGMTAGWLGLIELQVFWMRYRRRWLLSQTVEMVAPAWLRPMFRSDLAKRQGTVEMAVTDAQVDAWLRMRGVNPQWVVDWQDAFAVTATTFGGATPPELWPLTGKVMLYRAGTFFNAQNDVITIDGLYDSTLLSQNMHLAMFTEEGFKVGKKCWDSLVVTAPTCPDGTTTAGIVPTGTFPACGTP